MRRAATSRDPPVQALVALGNRELQNRQPQAALSAFDAAINLRPTFAAAFTGRALALKHLRRLGEAMSAGRQALELRRGWHPGATCPPGELDPAEIAEMRRTNRVKLVHDLAQLQHLTARGVSGAAVVDAATALAAGRTADSGAGARIEIGRAHV